MFEFIDKLVLENSYNPWKNIDFSMDLRVTNKHH
jgi:hypothetical protein